MNNKAMKWVYLAIAIMAISAAFDYSQKVGAAVLVMVVLGILISAQKRGALQLAGG